MTPPLHRTDGRRTGERWRGSPTSSLRAFLSLRLLLTRRRAVVTADKTPSRYAPAMNWRDQPPRGSCSQQGDRPPWTSRPFAFCTLFLACVPSALRWPIFLYNTEAMETAFRAVTKSPLDRARPAGSRVADRRWRRALAEAPRAARTTHRPGRCGEITPRAWTLPSPRACNRLFLHRCYLRTPRVRWPRARRTSATASGRTRRGRVGAEAAGPDFPPPFVLLLDFAFLTMTGVQAREGAPGGRAARRLPGCIQLSSQSSSLTCYSAPFYGSFAERR
ncbi:hypothetical protein HPB50_015763 [Hyalomma asiaticum]|uniref:Uncharacterized protein n=1 Tax=Hyalomma asiaticum TaxID=266040 RepID=A0ACB7SZB3_HYAAI|nr:hypothetical protein HPB50_015763 [Hyalomma asiaticum]